MIIEALVLTACLQNQGGCSESTSAYYQYNKDVQVLAKNAEEFGKRIVKGHEWLVYAVTPMYAAMSGQQSNFKLSKSWMLGVNVRKELLLLQWSY